MAYAKLLATTASDHPHGLAFISGDRQRTWREVKESVEHVAGGLIALGLKVGDRVAIVSGLAEGQAELGCAVSWAGMVLVPLNVRLGKEELLAILEDADVSAIAFDATHAAFAVQAADQLGIKIGIALDREAERPENHSLTSLVASKPLARVEQAENDLAMLIYTGGTTGTPKGVMLPFRSLIAEGEIMRDYIGYNRETVYLHAMAMFHVAGVAQFAGVTLGGGAHVFRPDGGPIATFEEIARSGVNTLCGAPTSLAMLLDSPARDDALLRTIRGFGYGSSSISEALLKRAIKAMPNARFVQFYGQSEASGTVIILDADWHVLEGPKAGKLRTTGRPDKRYRVRIVDEKGVEQPRGAAGEILVQGAYLSTGYWRQPEKTAELFRGGWLHTGDVGVMDADGFIAVVDRFKDMIITGGENVFCTEVENALAQHPAVSTCAVIGIPHDLWGEAVHAVVTLIKGKSTNEAELIAHCRQFIAGYKCPKSVDIVEDTLPLSGVGKVMKHVLREQYLSRNRDKAGLVSR
ncbi:Long-chain-fatty-acid--CoA ligase [Sphingobium indicum BiD32]|uniref:3-methylmercaptopropionyl-CoA ligase n=1 Tax=Sphingobium indicum BiD32 TaxID=1301087 RepID=N1MRD0_9SPHN|nr:AMP-binding protein [Sphingobium indicum]CCW19765.1 Long-chain-fatty-acid--CoA ligase [Sphingobium indicum BiD32]